MFLCSTLSLVLRTVMNRSVSFLCLSSTFGIHITIHIYEIGFVLLSWLTFLQSVRPRKIIDLFVSSLHIILLNDIEHLNVITLTPLLFDSPSVYLNYFMVSWVKARFFCQKICFISQLIDTIYSVINYSMG